eukprot:TRINITY_DN10974_c0_g1_i3.p1 TRINITY_DN10974_c0_g1~~TRINITY_DN10974_c0_g1_i3.p1  ORF type:complete len:798 (+),score=358.69 TRINITY_DN10974_c0_g1_i3:92-2395(+)
MAKVGHEDPRCIVSDRADGRNVHDWHWSERNITPQAKARLEKLLTKLKLIDDQGDRISIEAVKMCDGDATSLNRKGKIGVFWDFNVVLEWRAERKSAAQIAMDSVQGMLGGLGAEAGAGGNEELMKQLPEEYRSKLDSKDDKAIAIDGTMGMQGYDQENVDEVVIEVKVNPGTERSEVAEQLHRRLVTEGKHKLREKLRDWGKRLMEDYDPHRAEKFAQLKPGQKVQITRDGGVKKECVHPGTGNEFPTPGSKVKVHYVGTLHESGEQFDSSRDRGEPIVFEVLRGKVIKGWDEGIVTMRKGERSKLIIRSDYAYGEAGAGDKIPGKATLCFDVEVLDWEVLRTDVSKQQDLSVMKHVIEEGKASWQHPEYEGTVTIDISVVKGNTKWAAAGEGAEFVLGDDVLPPGIEHALEGMMQGELAELEVAQRQLGRWAADGESDPAVFRVRLLDFDNPAPASMLKGPALLAAVTKRKEQGTVLYKAEQLAQAQRKWTKAVEMIDAGWKSATPADQKALAQVKLPCLTNLAAVQLTLKHFRDCISSCDKALELDSRNVKAVLRRGKAFHGCGEDAEARKDFEWILQELEPANAEAKQELAKLDRAEKQAKEKDQKTFGGMFDKMSAKREEVAEKKRQEAKEQRKREAAEKYQKHLEELRSKGRLPQRVTVTTPRGEECSCVAGDYELDEDGPGYKGEPVWRSGDCRIYCDGLWWMVTDSEAKVAQGLGKLQSANAQGKMPHEVASWMRSDPAVGWTPDKAVTVTVPGAVVTP